MSSNVLPILSNPPSANIPPTLAAYLLTQVNVADYFNDTILGYRRLDYSSRNMPSLNVYLIHESYTTGLWWLEGDIILELCLPPFLKRENIALHSAYAANLLSLHLNSIQLIQTLEPDNPGLVEIASKFSWDYKNSTGLYSNDKVDAYTVKGTINFKVSLLEYYEKINPGSVIYDESSVVVDPC